MAIDISEATVADLEAVSALCLRSKAMWGYDADFMVACRNELILHAADLRGTQVAVGRQDDEIVAMAQLQIDGDSCELLKLFVDPASVGRGIGKIMLDWATAAAVRARAHHMRIEADPNAAPFYAAMGAVEIGKVASGSIAGRTLPVLRLTLV